jgi:hypothetical protein
MGKGYKHGGSNANPLNFIVKAYSTESELKADTPKENTIGVVTTADISSWIFSATAPTEPVANMVWISTTNYSTVEFNALKKNGIQVYPFSAKQYVSGAWVDVKAMSYQDGKWATWLLYLYKNGKEENGLIGGWTAAAKTASSGSPPTAMPTITNNGTSMTFALPHQSDGWHGGMCYTNNKINLNGITKLVMKLSNVVSDKSGGNRADVYIWSAIGASTNDNAVGSKTLSTGETECVIDVSNLNGDYHIGFTLISNNSTTTKLTVKEIYCS